MSEYIKVAGEVNKQYELLAWNRYEFEEQLGCPQVEMDFSTYTEAQKSYNDIKKYLCKMIMKYDSQDPASDGAVMEEDWNE